MRARLPHSKKTAEPVWKRSAQLGSARLTLARGLLILIFVVDVAVVSREAGEGEEKRQMMSERASERMNE